jgi:acyl-CoA hydrolase
MEKRDQLLARWRELERGVRAHDRLVPAEVEDERVNRDGGRRRALVTIPSTEIVVRKQYLPRERNMLGNIFGGEILQMMDRTATYAARFFTKNEHMITVAMDRVMFKCPVTTRDLVEMRARVVYVRTYVLIVEVAVWVHRFQEKQPVQSHTGFLTLLNFDEQGFKRRIQTGLQLEEDDQDALRSYAMARALHEFSVGGASGRAGHDPSLTPRDSLSGDDGDDDARPEPAFRRSGERVQPDVARAGQPL